MAGSVCGVSDVVTPDPADDDAYRGLFREAPPVAPMPPVLTEPVDEPEPENLVAEDDVLPAVTVDEAVDVEEAVEPAPAPAEPVAPDRPTANTGRLFRSTRATSSTEALVAVRQDQAHRLRTLTVDDSVEPTPAAALLVSSTPAPVMPALPEPEVEASMRRAPRNRGLNSLGVITVVGGVTLLLGLLDIVIGGAGLGTLTGVGLVIASAFAALRVRADDAPVCIMTPPIAFFVAALTVGQIGQGSTGGLLGRAVVVFFMLADNWFWIIGATVVALIIVLVRGRQSR